MLRLLLYFLFSVSYVLATDDLITYNVLSITPLTPGQSIFVSVDGTHYLLEQSHLPLLYTGAAPTAQSSYQYILSTDTLVQPEPFERAPTYLTAQQSFYDIFGQAWHKQDDMHTLPQLYSFDKDRYSPLGGMNDPVACQLYQEGTIATIHISASPEEVVAMHQNKMDKKFELLADLTYINYNTMQVFQNVTFKVSGHSSRLWSKVPYKVNIPVESYPNGLYRRWHLKLRPESTDPTMVREKLYNDILKSTGIVAARGGYIRLFINDNPIGLFLTVDDPASPEFIREVMYATSEMEPGSIIKADAAEGSTTANLNYLGEDMELYEKKTYEVKHESPEGHLPAIQHLVDFTRFIRHYNSSDIPNDHRAFDLWEKHLDVTSYLRQLAIEWIAGNWDAHQYAGNNYILHHDTVKNRYVVLPVDFDYTFGNGVESDQIHFLTGKPLDIFKGQPINSYLWDKIRATPYLLDMYYETIKDINSQLTTPDLLNQRIDALVNLIESSIVWDQSLVSQTVGIQSIQTGLDDFKSAIVTGSKKKVDQLIGLKEWIEVKYNSIIKHFI